MIKIPSDFDYKIYSKLNPDLNILTEKEAIFHYLNFGLKENRLYKNILPTDFNYLNYILFFKIFMGN